MKWTVILTCMFLALVRTFWPELGIDAITISLVCIALLGLMLPELSKLIPYIKRLKVGEAEIEINQEEITRQVNRNKGIARELAQQISSSKPEEIAN